MDIGIGLPTTIPGADGPTLIEWARHADEAGFESLGTLDRLVYDSYDPIAALGAAAAVTDDLRLTTAVILTPYRGNGVLLAKQLASLDQLSGGRVTVGVGVGGHSEDYLAAAEDFSRRGAAQDRMLAEMRAVWAGEARDNGGIVGPPPAQPSGLPLLIGGSGRAAIRRVVEHGSGWIAGGGGPEMFSKTAQQVQQAWADEGRDGVPYLAATAFFALGEHAKAASRRYLLDFYSFLGDAADRIAQSALTDPETLKREIAGFAEADCDELILFPCSADADEIDLLARAALR
jgi:alkanesulfonate monooxygenase SsuD/methylene tetrahydromethanopterin reductase-like flavin-dependent oxidoreductase (luciferase family)